MLLVKTIKPRSSECPPFCKTHPWGAESSSFRTEEMTVKVFETQRTEAKSSAFLGAFQGPEDGTRATAPDGWRML